MFYSQFILAKKGPLGTIWIAAHLERKLRKNQVAETDIGVSVDSILSPDVPIALRLSSHLLLGVVRIYSRKVNYLFHDCSEALLKIKQAFRSTVVDLPPEESTAPYHSITLPETFDLDEFELPDSALLGNYTDHHVSTREQITLQDSVDDTGYATLQFGLDERFGDGDSSQIRLVLDEELFMDHVPSPQHASGELSTKEGTLHEGQPSTASTNMDIDEGKYGSHGLQNFRIPNLSDVLSNDCDKHELSSVEILRMSGDSSQRQGYNIQTPDLNQLFFPDDHFDDPSAIPDHQAFSTDYVPSPDLFDHAQAPSTPGLLEEAIRANVQEIPGFSPQEKTSSPNAMEVMNTDNSVSPQLDFEGTAAVNTINPVNEASMNPEPEDTARSVSSLSAVLTEANPISAAPECSGGVLTSFGEAHVEFGQRNDDHLQSEFVVSTKTVSLASECLGGTLDAPEATRLECQQKISDQINSGFVCNEVSNQTIMHDAVEVTKVAHLEFPAASGQCLQASELDTHSNKKAAEEIVVSSPNNVCVPGVISEINIASLGNTIDPSILANQEHVEDVNSCLTSKTSVLSSDLYLRPCNSQMDVVNILPLEAGIDEADPSTRGSQDRVINGDLIDDASAPSSDLHLLPCNSPLNQANILSAEAGNTPVISSGVRPEIHLREQPVHGDDTNTTHEVYHQSDSVLSDVSKLDDQLTSVFSKETTPKVNSNCLSNSGYPEPERMLLASSCDVNLPNDLGEITAVKGVSESAESINETSSLSGKKRHSIDSSQVLQNSNSVKRSRLARVKRSASYMPDDDDLLASILVGRIPSLRMGPTPLPPKASSRKRPCLTHQGGVQKRKVMLDDTMVLHADEIRKQLVNIEDIRRVRKKAPCTRAEISMISRSLMEEEIFTEALFMGLSMELNNLSNRRYEMNENRCPQTVDHHLDEFDLYVKQSTEKERSRIESVSNNIKEMDDLTTTMPNQLENGIHGSFNASVAAHTGKEAELEVQEELEFDVSRLEPSSNNQVTTGNVHEKGEVITVLQEHGVLHDLVQPSDKPMEMSDRTSNFPKTSIDDVASAEDETKCTLVDSAMQVPKCNQAFGFDVEERLEHHVSQLEPLRNNQTVTLSPRSGPDLGFATVSTSEAEALDILQEPELLHNMTQPSDKSMEMTDRTSKFEGTVVDGVQHSDYADRNNPALCEDTRITDDTFTSKIKGGVDIVDSNGSKYSHDVGEIENGEILVSLLDKCLLEEQPAGLSVASPNVVEHANDSIQDTAAEIGEPTEGAMNSSSHAMNEMRTELDATANDEHMVEKMLADVERPPPEVSCSENPQSVSSFLYQHDTETENVPSAVGDNSGMLECIVEGNLDVESAPVDIGVARESSDLYNALDDNDTEFLNADYEADFDDAADNDIPDSEASIENSGWSTRTRGVARYLKTLFDEDRGRGRKTIAVNHLLSGKTRKEASRMFFETLVLKTRDYIHVEQEIPFEGINIKPRPKLLKSEF